LLSQLRRHQANQDIEVKPRSAMDCELAEMVTDGLAPIRGDFGLQRVA
jgi:hypothetical protein